MLDLQATNHRRRLLINFQFNLSQRVENIELARSFDQYLSVASGTMHHRPVSPPPVLCPESFASGLPTRTLSRLLSRPTA